MNLNDQDQNNLKASELEIANKASIQAIQESYNQMVLEHRHVWIMCD
ncbi:MAG: hypothetical protein H7235_09515 [Bdellovibrionaceae bacterium]|nr:hypothetical protein [Pseudobdellovibrionaceae bacterium]